MLPQNISIQGLPSQQRRARKPKHAFKLKHRPYQVQPFAIAPVLPGETMTSATIQARAKTSPLASDVDLTGWWLEHYLFYVKLTDLVGRDDFMDMLLDASKDMSSHETAADVQTYHSGNGIDWLSLCMDRCIDEYFRDEGDGTVTFDGLPQAQIVGESWLDSAKLETDTETHDHQFPGDDPVVPDNYSGDFGTHYTQWEHMRAMNLTAATFEDWGAQFGIKTDTKPARKDYRPELLRYSRDWQYPSTVVHSGATTSACVWSVVERADKKRLFKEPGFVVGFTVARPKVYLSTQRGTGASMMTDAYAWLPAVLREQAFTSLKKFTVATGGSGPLTDTPSGDYWVDIRDLLIYGDQFANFDVSATPAGFVALPTAAMQKKYATETNIDALFDDALGGFKHIHQDGILQLDILGMQSDQT